MHKTVAICFALPTPVYAPSSSNTHINRRNESHFSYSHSNAKRQTRRVTIPPLNMQASTGQSKELNNVQLRPAEPRDLPRIMYLVASEKMNPLIGSPDRFIVCEADLETPESTRHTHNDVNSKKTVIGCGQVRRGVPAELSSLVVHPVWRGRGIGSRLVSELVKLYGENKRIVLLTLSTTETLYQRYGFAVMDEHDREMLPLSLRMEYSLGTVSARLFAPHARLICMAREKGQWTE